MSQSRSKRIFDIKQAVRDNSGEPTSELSSLFEIIEKGYPEADEAAMAIDTIAKDEPDAVTPLVDRIAELLSASDDKDIGYYLTQSLRRIADTSPETLNSARDGLVDAATIDPDRLQADPKKELLTVRKAFEAWIALVDAGYDIPEQVTRSTIDVLRTGNNTAINTAIDLLEAILSHGIEGQQVALNVFFDLIEAENPTIRERAVVAVANAVLEQDIRSHGAIEQFLSENAEEVRPFNRETVDTALETLGD